MMEYVVSCFTGAYLYLRLSAPHIRLPQASAVVYATFWDNQRAVYGFSIQSSLEIEGKT